MRRRLPRIIVGVLLLLLPVATAANYALTASALRDGKRARATQCRVFPIQQKLYRGAAHYHIITARDLRTFLASAPRDCP